MMQSIYVMVADNRVKVGRSRQVEARKVAHERDKGITLTTAYVTEGLADALAVERIACRILRNQGHQVTGEWFSAPPAEAVMGTRSFRRWL